MIVANQIAYIKSSKNMRELDDGSVQLVVTSPPYFVNKDYGSAENNIEESEDFEDYIKNLRSVFEECFRVLKPDGKLCINISPAYGKTKEYGRYKRLPVEDRLAVMMEDIGMDYYDTIIWYKKRFGSSGAVMGSYPHPTNLLIQGQHEYIKVFRKWVSEDYFNKREMPGKDIKEKSEVTKEEWREFTQSVWEISGTSQDDHPAQFPYEIPYRLIKLYSFHGDTVLDPFLGSGTTLKASEETGRKGVGYEIEDKYEEVIKKKVDDVKIVK